MDFLTIRRFGINHGWFASLPRRPCPCGQQARKRKANQAGSCDAGRSGHEGYRVHGGTLARGITAQAVVADNRLVGVDIREVVMPELQGAEEITVGAWNKKRGDEVAEGETLMEVHTDKVNAEIPSPVAGVVQDLLLEVGDPGLPGQPFERISAW